MPSATGKDQIAMQHLLWREDLERRVQEMLQENDLSRDMSNLDRRMKALEENFRVEREERVKAQSKQELKELRYSGRNSTGASGVAVPGGASLEESKWAEAVEMKVTEV